MVTYTTLHQSTVSTTIYTCLTSKMFCTHGGISGSLSNGEKRQLESAEFSSMTVISRLASTPSLWFLGLIPSWIPVDLSFSPMLYIKLFMLTEDFHIKPQKYPGFVCMDFSI